MLNSREYLALMTNPLPAESDTTKIEATFYSRAEKRDIRFPLPRRFWRAVTLTLLPPEVDADPAKWVSIGTLRISSKTLGMSALDSTHRQKVGERSQSVVMVNPPSITAAEKRRTL